MGVVSMVGKVVLVVVNILVLLLSLVMAALGVVIVAGSDLYSSLLDSARSHLESGLTSAGVTLDTSDFTLQDFLLPLAYGLIALGVVMGGLAVLGCLGGCCTIKVVLLVYAVLLGVLLLIQLVITALVYVDRSAFDATAKKYIKDTLDDYSGIEDTSTKGMAWNALMNYQDCCGVDGYSDFTGLTTWPPSTIAGVAVTDLKTPIMCCKTIPTVSSDYSCATNAGATSSNNNQDTGCYDELFSLVVDHALVITTVACLLALQVVLLFFTIWILCTMNNKIDII